MFILGDPKASKLVAGGTNNVLLVKIEGPGAGIHLSSFASVKGVSSNPSINQPTNGKRTSMGGTWWNWQAERSCFFWGVESKIFKIIFKIVMSRGETARVGHIGHVTCSLQIAAAHPGHARGTSAGSAHRSRPRSGCARAASSGRPAAWWRDPHGGDQSGCVLATGMTQGMTLKGPMMWKMTSQ